MTTTQDDKFAAGTIETVCHTHTCTVRLDDGRSVIVIVTDPAMMPEDFRPGVTVFVELLERQLARFAS